MFHIAGGIVLAVLFLAFLPQLLAAISFCVRWGLIIIAIAIFEMAIHHH